MPATKREQNVAKIDGRLNTAWAVACERYLASEQAYLTLWDQYNQLRHLATIKAVFPDACNILDIAMGRILEEGVRRGVLPEQTEI